MLSLSKDKNRFLANNDKMCHEKNYKMFQVLESMTAKVLDHYNKYEVESLAGQDLAKRKEKFYLVVEGSIKDQVIAPQDHCFSAQASLDLELFGPMAVDFSQPKRAV